MFCRKDVEKITNNINIYMAVMFTQQFETNDSRSSVRKILQ